MNKPNDPHGYLLPFTSPDATLGRVGGKGAALARLAAAGLPVPGGFHVTTEAYRAFVDENRLDGVILAAAASARADLPATLEAASSTIRAAFESAGVPAAVAEAIRAAYGELGEDENPAVAVRSSATAEDLPTLSFAGQQETYLNVRGADAVVAAVKRCWGSLWTARALGYRALEGIRPEDVRLAVVVQRLVAADVSGILFTANPLTGARDQTMINAAWGLGEAVVGSLVTPDTLVMNTATGAVMTETVADKTIMTVRTAPAPGAAREGLPGDSSGSGEAARPGASHGTREAAVPDLVAGTREVAVPADRRRMAALTHAAAAELTALGARIQALFGAPMDIEWAIAGGQSFILQARPITALPERPVVLDWTLPRPAGRYARSSVIELLPDPLSPLFRTLALPAWSRGMNRLMHTFPFGDILPDPSLVSINDYAYYDYGMTAGQSLRMLWGFLAGGRSLARLLGTAATRWSEDARPHYAALATEWAHADLEPLSSAALLDGVRAVVEAAAGYYLTIQSGILPVAYMSEAVFTGTYARFAQRSADPPALTFMLGFASEPIRAEQSLWDLALWARTQPALADDLRRMPSASIVALLRGGETFGTGDASKADGVPSADPASGIGTAAWQTFAARFADHLERFGHAIYDLDFAKPLPADDPAPLLEALKHFLAGEGRDPHARQAAASAARTQATDDLLGRLTGLRGRWFRWILPIAQRYAPLREDALADVGLGWPAVRRLSGELGRRLVAAGIVDTAEDVYWLTVDELAEAAARLDAAWGSPPVSHRDTVTARRAAWARARRVTPPVVLPARGGARFFGFDFSRFMPAHTGEQSGDVLTGIGASPGRVGGVACVLHGPEAFHRMRHGDILVAKITTPAWTPLFALAAGVVTDVGGPLSHSSIVAREYGIPAVLGTGVATQRIAMGQTLVVDGSKGEVALGAAAR